MVDHGAAAVFPGAAGEPYCTCPRRSFHNLPAIFISPGIDVRGRTAHIPQRDRAARRGARKSWWGQKIVASGFSRKAALNFRLKAEATGETSGKPRGNV